MIKFTNLEELKLNYNEWDFFKNDNNILTGLSFSKKKDIEEKFLQQVNKDLKHFDSFQGLGKPYKVRCGYNEWEGIWVIDYESSTRGYRNFWLVDIIYK